MFLFKTDWLYASLIWDYPQILIFFHSKTEMRKLRSMGPIIKVGNKQYTTVVPYGTEYWNQSQRNGVKTACAFLYEWGYIYSTASEIYSTSKMVEQINEGFRFGFTTFSLRGLGLVLFVLSCKSFSVISLTGFSDWFCVFLIINIFIKFQRILCFSELFGGCFSGQNISETQLEGFASLKSTEHVLYS